MKHLFVLMVAFLITPFLSAQDHFYAYHTKLEHTATDYLGKYADLIVVLGAGKELQFTRKKQYMPQWKTEKGTFMVDDFFPERTPDYQFFYNYVRLIEESPEKIVIHWTYIPDVTLIEEGNAIPNPTIMDGFTSVVHETFTIYPDGKVIRKMKDTRGTSYVDWNSPDYGATQTLLLMGDGITHGSVDWGNNEEVEAKVITKSLLIIDQTGIEPVLNWTFDEAGGDFPKEEGEEEEEHETCLSNITYEHKTFSGTPILGHCAYYEKGVSGMALAFDGYYTGVAMKTFQDFPNATYDNSIDFPEIKDELTVEAWVALDAYPWNLAPIIHHSTGFGMQGYYFGVDPYGKVVLKANNQELISSDKLELSTWTHVSAIMGNGEMAIYLNGEKAVSQKFAGDIKVPRKDLIIGLNDEKLRCSDYVRSDRENIPFIFGTQGLIDEVKIYDQVVTASQLKEKYNTFLPDDLTSPLEKAILPGEVGMAKEFGAYYKNLKHQEIWDNMWRLSDHTDIVVKFDTSPASVVYWHGTNFAANWVVDNNRWMVDQSSETFRLESDSLVKIDIQ
ncbi:MAG: LamG domain-containing protein [Bacteroidota bacterium]